MQRTAMDVSPKSARAVRVLLPFALHRSALAAARKAGTHLFDHIVHRFAVAGCRRMRSSAAYRRDGAAGARMTSQLFAGGFEA